MSTNIFSTATTAQAVAEMTRWGGEGMQKLAACWIAFDPERRAILESALKHDFDRYRQMAVQENELKAQQTLAQRAAQDVAARDCRN